MNRETSPNPPAESDPRTFFAAERTLLAWVRTALAMMGFGFVVARFGLFLRELAAVGNRPIPRFGWSLGIGTALVAIGVAVSLLAAFQHLRTIRRLREGRPLQFNAWSLGVVLAGLLSAVGLVMTTYLLFVSNSK